VSLSHPNYDGLNQISQVLGRWRFHDIKLFLAQLIACRFTDWYLNPGNQKPVRQQLGLDNANLNLAVREIALRYLVTDPTILYHQTKFEDTWDDLLSLISTTDAAARPSDDWTADSDGVRRFVQHLENLRCTEWKPIDDRRPGAKPSLDSRALKHYCATLTAILADHPFVIFDSFMPLQAFRVFGLLVDEGSMASLARLIFAWKPQDIQKFISLALVSSWRCLENNSRPNVGPGSAMGLEFCVRVLQEMVYRRPLFLYVFITETKESHEDIGMRLLRPFTASRRRR